MLNLQQYKKRAITGGVIATLLIAAGAFLLGSLSAYEAKELFKTSLPGVNMLCRTVVVASATIMALLLTLLGLSSNTDSKLKKSHYKQVQMIAKIDAGLFIAAILIFQLTNIPLTEAENLPKDWYISIYWVSLGLSSLISGAMVSVILMLYNTVSNIISIVGLGHTDNPIISDDETDME
jgi:hypothetical protein